MARRRASMREGPLAELFKATEAAQRSRVWSANGCERLRQALASNAGELQAMLDRLYSGQLPPRVDEVPGQPLPEPIAGTRQVMAEPVGLYRMTRAGDDVTLAYRYSWLPLADE